MRTVGETMLRFVEIAVGDFRQKDWPTTKKARTWKRPANEPQRRLTRAFRDRCEAKGTQIPRSVLYFTFYLLISIHYSEETGKLRKQLNLVCAT